MMDDFRSRVHQRIAETRAERISFLQQMVRIRSINPVFLSTKPEEERLCQEFLAARLKTLGFVDIDMWEPDAEALKRAYEGKPGYTPNRQFENRPNLVARLPGSGGGRSIFLTGHIDVVGANPATEAWNHDPFAATIVDGRLYGRGSVDMKGGVAAMVEAVSVLKDLGVQLKGDVLFGTVVDEETGSMGMLSLVDRGYRADAGIMPEPTGNRLSLLCRGIIWGRIRVPGRSGHIEVFQASADRGGASDAIRGARRLMDEIDELNREWARRPEKKHPLLRRPNEINVSMIRGGQHPSAYAEECEFTVDIQYLPAERDPNGLGGTIKREVEDRLRVIAEQDPYLRDHPIEFDWFVDADCGEVPINHEFAQIAATVLQEASFPSQPEGSEFHTDMSLLTNNGTPTINLGPGDPMLAHQTNEYIELNEYLDAIALFAELIVRWCWVESIDD